MQDNGLQIQASIIRKLTLGFAWIGSLADKISDLLLYGVAFLIIIVVGSPVKFYCLNYIGFHPPEIFNGVSSITVETEETKGQSLGSHLKSKA